MTPRRKVREVVCQDIFLPGKTKLRPLRLGVFAFGPFYLCLPPTPGFLDGFRRISFLISTMARSICGSRPAA